MSDQPEATPADGKRVEIDDPFEVPQEVEEAWEDEHVGEGEAPSG